MRALMVQRVRCCDDVTAFCRGEFYGSQFIQMTHGPVNTTRTRKAATFGLILKDFHHSSLFYEKPSLESILFLPAYLNP